MLHLLLLLLFIFVHPYDSWGTLFYYIHFIVGAIFRTSIAPSDMVWCQSTLLTICWYVLILATLGKFVHEACIQTFVQVIVLGITAEKREVFTLVKDLANKNSVHSYATLSSEIHYTRVSIALLVEEMLIIFVHEIDFYCFHSIFYSLKGKMVPVWGEAKEFSEVRHVHFKQCHYNSGIQNAIISSKFQKSPGFLHQNGGSLLMLIHIQWINLVLNLLSICHLLLIYLCLFIEIMCSISFVPAFFRLYLLGFWSRIRGARICWINVFYLIQWLIFILLFLFLVLCLSLNFTGAQLWLYVFFLIIVVLLASSRSAWISSLVLFGRHLIEALPRCTLNFRLLERDLLLLKERLIILINLCTC